MRKIKKSLEVPKSLQNAPIPKSAEEVKKEYYKAEDVREQLIKDQSYKCAYCESRISKEYNDVEHYRPKVIYWWLGHDWNNLLYSCPFCNRTCKKSEFPLLNENNRARTQSELENEEPLILNPIVDEIIDHIEFHRHIIVGKTEKGRKTIEIFRLNKRADLLNDRRNLFEKYENDIKRIRIAQDMLKDSQEDSEIYKLAKEMLELSLKSIEENKKYERPYSGVLVNQQESSIS